MPPTSSGKWVSRAAATGGGRTYRGQVPVNWYAGLIAIVILGLVSIVFARYEYQHKSTSGVSPTVGQTLYAAYAFDICGKVLPALTVNNSIESAGLATPGDGVIQVSPKTSAEAGNNATFGLFLKQYAGGVSVSATAVTPTAHKTYTNGEVCPKGTPDAGKKGEVKAETWPNAVTTHGTPLTGDPSAYKIAARSLITVGFVAADTQLKRPSQSDINEMLEYAGSVANGTTSTTTTTTTPTSTTLPPISSTTTTAPTGTTTTTK
jgi:hypothetical protein